MARTIKFALEVMKHFVSGNLEEWLNDRGNEAKAELKQPCYRLPDVAKLKQILADSHPIHRDLGKVWLARDFVGYEDEFRDYCWGEGKLRDYKACLREIIKYENGVDEKHLSEAEVQEEFKGCKERVIDALHRAIYNSAYTHEKYSEEDIIRCVFDAFGGEPYTALTGSWWCLTKDSLLVIDRQDLVLIPYESIISADCSTEDTIHKILRINFRKGEEEFVYKGSYYNGDFYKTYECRDMQDAMEQLGQYLNTVKDLFAGRQTFGRKK